MNEQATLQMQVASEASWRTSRGGMASTAHDLCNQLQVIESALNVLRHAVRADGATTLDHVFSAARSAVNRACQLSRAIVDTGGQGSATACRISLVERLASLPELAVLASASNIWIEQRVNDDVPDIFCDPDALADAILNIVVNARRAMPGGGRILISAARECAALEGFPAAVLRIADTGCGMSPEIAARAFEPNFTTRGKGEGSGLGLAMVAAFARSAGGVAEIESRLGVGTVVTLRLPGLMKPVSAVARANETSTN